MIHVVTCENAHLYAEALDQMFRLRAEHFVVERGWTGLTVKDGREVDDFDDERAIYLLGIEPDGSVSVSVRLRPTDDTSLLEAHFAHLVAAHERPIARADTWESCRYFAAGPARGRGGARRQQELRLAMLEVARRHEVNRIVAITDTVFLPPLLQGSWRVRLLGLPAAYAEGECLAIEIDTSAEALFAMREAAGLPRADLLHLRADQVPAEQRPHEVEASLSEAGPLTAEESALLARMQSRLSTEDLQMLTRIAQRVSEIEAEHGEDVAASSVEHVIRIVRGLPSHS